MKKLLITTMAAVSVGLCAKAADAIDASNFTGNDTSFDDLTTGADFAGDNKFWQTPEGEGDLFKIIDVVYPEGATPQHWALATQEKALSIDTATPIFRNVNPVSDGNPPLDVSKKSVFFDSVVQFTATDVAPSMENNTTDKLAVWLYSSPDDVSDTNQGLFGETSPITRVAVTAGYSSDGANLITKNYLTNIEVEPDTWHRLTIKSFNDSDDGDLLFNIWVDKTQVSGKEMIEAQETTTDFLSRIPDSVNQDTFNKLQGVAFDGKGAVDDIVFTTTEPEFAKNSDGSEVFNVAITAPNGVEIDSVMDGNGDSIEVSEGKCVVGVGTETIIVLVKCAGTVTNAGAEEQGSGIWAVTVDVSSAKEGDSILVEITVAAGGSAKPTIGGVEVVVDDNGKITNITTANNGQAVTGEITDAMFADYYDVSVVDGKLVIAIDPAVATPQINATSDDADDAIVVTETAVALGVTNAKVGLWYGAQAYSDAACTTKIGDEPTGWEQAEGETVTVTVVKPDAGTAFFKVVVDDQDHTPAEEQN